MPSEVGTSCSVAVPVVTAAPTPSAIAGPDPAPLVWEKWEVRLASKTATQLRRRFPQKPRLKVINELLDGMLEERKARELLNLNHWPEYGPGFLGSLAEKWKLHEAARLEAMPGFLKANRKGMLNLALSVAGNLPDAELAVAESDFEYLTGAADQAFYPLSVKRNAVDIVRKRERGAEAVLPLDRVFEAGDDCLVELDDDSEGVARFSSQSPASFSDGKDPLQVLLDRRSRHLARTRKSKAKKKLLTRRKYKDSRRKKWAKKLGIHAKSGADLPR